MAKRAKSSMEHDHTMACKCKCGSTGAGGCTYGLGFLGAAIYYISTATGFWMGFFGVIKAFFWPAVLVFHLLKLVGA